MNLTSTTLVIVTLVPFAPLAAQFWWAYRPSALRTFNLLCSLFSVVFALWIFLQMVKDPDTPKLIYVVHILPLVYTALNLNLRAILLYPEQRAQMAGSSNPLPPIKRKKPVIEKIAWEEVIIDEKLKKELVSIVHLLKEPSTAKKYGIDIPKGILLSGPPGTGKTTIAKAIASNANLPFFVLQSEEIVSKWVGESEKNLSTFFESATAYAPSVIFIDEIDSIGKTRSGEPPWADNLLNHLLQLIDGVIKREGVYIIGATNRPELVDSALKRSGRLNRVIEIPLPDYDSRIKIFHLYLSKLSLQEPLSLDLLAQISEGCSGADIQAICNQAGLNAFQREVGQKQKDYKVTQDDIKEALRAFLC